MIDLEACALAGELLRAAGFEHRHTSLKSEAAYYGWPERHQVIRVACHRAHRSELNGIPIIATITFNVRNFKLDRAGVSQIGREYLVNVVANAIGRYMLVSSGALQARARYRQYWTGGRTELTALETVVS